MDVTNYLSGSSGPEDCQLFVLRSVLRGESYIFVDKLLPSCSNWANSFAILIKDFKTVEGSLWTIHTDLGQGIQKMR